MQYHVNPWFLLTQFIDVYRIFIDLYLTLRWRFQTKIALPFICPKMFSGEVRGIGECRTWHVDNNGPLWLILIFDLYLCNNIKSRSEDTTKEIVNCIFWWWHNLPKYILSESIVCVCFFFVIHNLVNPRFLSTKIKNMGERVKLVLSLKVCTSCS
jgi:hypothetical protein